MINNPSFYDGVLHRPPHPSIPALSRTRQAVTRAALPCFHREPTDVGAHLATSSSSRSKSSRHPKLSRAPRHAVHQSRLRPSRGTPLWQNHLREGFIARINLSDSRWSENTINTHKYNTTYWSSSISYYILASLISYIEEVWSQNYASKNKSEFAEVISLNGQDIPFALKENTIHRHSKPEDPSTGSILHRFGLLTDNPRRHRRQEEAVSHLHTEDSKSKAWPTMLSKTYPRWPKHHL
jgi:hypothetical protein